MISMLEQLLADIPLSAASTVTWIIVGVLAAAGVVLLFIESVRSVGAILLSLIGIDSYFYFTGGLYLYPAIKGWFESLSESLGQVLPWVIFAAVILVLLGLLLFKFTAYFICIPLGLIAIDAATLINQAFAAEELTAVMAALYYAIVAFVLSFAFSINYVMPTSSMLDTTSRPFGKDFAISKTISLLLRSAAVFGISLLILSIDTDADLSFISYILVGVIPIVAAALFICRLFSYADETADVVYKGIIRINRFFTAVDIAIYTVILRLLIPIGKLFALIGRGIFWLIKNIVRIIWIVIKAIGKAIWWVIKLIGKLLVAILKFIWRHKIFFLIVIAIAVVAYFVLHYFGII